MEYEGVLSQGQYACLVLVTAGSSFVSILGSTAVTRIAYLKMTSTYQRFLFMLSLMDILSSLFLMFHQLILPKSEAFYWAFGSQKSCTMAGFFLHFGTLAVAMYSSFLSLYFYFSIQFSSKREKQPEDVIGYWEWGAHACALLLPGGVAVAAAATGNIDVAEGLGLCAIESFECARGEIDESACVSTGNDEWSIPQDTQALRWSYFASMIASIVASVISTLLVSGKVRSTLRSDDNGLTEEVKQRLRAVATQAVLYTGVFLNTLIWPILAIIIPTDTKAPVYFLHLLAFFFYPLQGVFNCLIYIRPRYQMLRTMYPDDSIIVVARVSLSKAGDPDEIEEVRERIYGDSYEPPSVESSVHSLASGLPNEVAFNPDSPLSKTSLVSVPADDDDMDPEASPRKKHTPKLANVQEAEDGEDSEDAKST